MVAAGMAIAFGGGNGSSNRLDTPPSANGGADNSAQDEVTDNNESQGPLDDLLPPVWEGVEPGREAEDGGGGETIQDEPVDSPINPGIDQEASPTMSNKPSETPSLRPSARATPADTTAKSSGAQNDNNGNGQNDFDEATDGKQSPPLDSPILDGRDQYDFGEATDGKQSPPLDSPVLDEPNTETDPGATPTTSATPSVLPTTTLYPPSFRPSMGPSLRPTTSEPTVTESTVPSIGNGGGQNDPGNNGDGIVNFYLIADVPYNPKERDELGPQITDIPSDGEFVVHLGDIRSAREGQRCDQAEYTYLGDVLRNHSHAPAFVVVGGMCVSVCDDANKPAPFRVALW